MLRCLPLLVVASFSGITSVVVVAVPAAAAPAAVSQQQQQEEAQQQQQEEEDRWQITIGEPDDWPGATGLAYRYLDSVVPGSAGGELGGWVVGGWAQGLSAVARVASNGTVLWSHKLVFREASQTVCQGVAAMVDGGAVVAGYTYAGTAANSRAWVLRLDPLGDVVYSRLITHLGASEGLRITSVARATDGGVMLMGGGASSIGVYSIKLDREGLPVGGWVTDHDAANHARDLKELPNGHFVYTGNEYVPNMADHPLPQQRATPEAAAFDNHWFIHELDDDGRPVMRGWYGDTGWGHVTDIVHVPASRGNGEEGYLLSGHLQKPREYDTSKIVIRVTADLRRVIWSRHLQNLPRYINDHSSQGVALSEDGLVAVTGIAENLRSVVSFLNYSTGEVAFAKHYGRGGARSHIQRVESIQEGGLLFVGNHEVREDGRYATLTYMVKTDVRGASGCAGREADIQPPPAFDDANIAAATTAEAPRVPIELGVEESELELDPW